MPPSKPNLIRLPMVFFKDHEERELPTPKVVRQNVTHVWVSENDTVLDELLNDAQFYAGVNDIDRKEHFGLISSARATAKAIMAVRRHKVYP